MALKEVKFRVDKASPIELTVFGLNDDERYSVSLGVEVLEILMDERSGLSEDQPFEIRVMVNAAVRKGGSSI